METVPATRELEPSPTLHAPFRPEGRPPRASFRPLFLTAAFIIALMGGFAGFSLWQSLENHQSRARTDLENLTHMLEQYIHSSLLEIDLMLQTAADEFNHQLRTGGIQEGNLKKFLKDHQARLPQIISLRITDATGTVRHGEGVDPTKSVNLADRDFYQRARELTTNEMVISLPVFARISQAWVIPMARRLTAADGTFAGIVYANLALDHLHEVFANLNLGDQGTVTLFSEQRLIYTRYPPPKEGLAKTVGFLMKSPQITEMMEQGRTSATYDAVSSLDQTLRTFSYRKAGNYPIFVMAGLAQKDYLVRWWQEVWVAGAFLAVFILTVLGATLMLMRAWRQQSAVVETLSARDLHLSRLVVELRQSEQRSQAAELRYRTLFELSPDGILVIDPETAQPVEFNQAACMQLGYTADAYAALDLGKMEAKESPEEIREHVVKLKSAGRDDFETLLRHKDGSLRHIFVTSLMVQIEDRTLIFSIHRDITAFKQAEATIRENELRLREITASLAEGLFVTDRQGCIEFINPAALHLTGLEENEALGKDSHLLFQHGCGPNLPCSVGECALHTAMAQQRVVRQENSYFSHQDGSTFPVAIIAAPILREGEVQGVVAAFHDITERRRHEAELHLAKEAAIAANRAKSDFLAAVSHDIRTPMNAIIGMGEMLQEAPLGDEQRGYVETINRAGAYLLSLLNDLLDLSKIEAGQLELEHIDFNLPELVTDTVDILRFQASGKGLALTARIDPNIQATAWVQGDPNRLRQILLNLMGNAIKFTHTGGVAVEVGAGTGETIHFSVRDTGIGIPAESLAAIFRPFVQANAATSRRFGGTGLGLAICQHLVTLMNGRIEVDSTVGQGSAFRFTLSLPVSSRRPQGGGSGLVPETAPDPRDSRALTILAADDSDESRLLLRGFLKESGHELHLVEHGLAALEQLRTQAFDIILMDMEMPGMDGTETIRRIRESERIGRRRQTPIIAITAHTAKERIEELFQAGCTLYLAKPFKKSTLLQTIIMAVAASAIH